jgi:glycosyltransferase involved in cell wall biosynthesis
VKGRGAGERPPPLEALQVRSSSSRYGPETSLLELVPSLERHGVHTQFLALYRRPASGPELHPWIAAARAAGVQADQVLDPGPLALGTMRRLGRRLRASGAQVVHTHDYRSNILGGVVTRRPDASVPWVATVHLYTNTTRRLRLYRAVDLFLLRLADRVVTVSRDQRRMLLARGVDRRRLVLVPTVVDAAACVAAAGEPAEARAALALPPGARVVTLVGRLTAQKGVDTFLDAARLVLARRPETRFVIVGDGPDRAWLEARAEAGGLNGAAAFLGYRSDIPRVLAASDIVVMPSRAEGLPHLLLEAMAVERAVVASQVGGIPDVVHHGETGLLVRPAAADEVADGILRLIAEPELAKRLGRAGRRYVERHCSPEMAARRLASLYRAVLAERG